jgi:hypothetical protein
LCRYAAVLVGIVPATDPDVGEALTLSIQTQATNGVVVVLGDPTNMQYEYRPNANFVGQDEFAYKVTDRRGGNSNAIITITVINVNDEAFGACQVPANIPAAIATLAAAEVATVKAGTSGTDNLTPTATDHVFEGVTDGMADEQVAKQWLKTPPKTSQLLDLELLTGPLAAVGTRDEILKSWHIACGHTVFADGARRGSIYKPFYLSSETVLLSSETVLPVKPFYLSNATCTTTASTSDRYLIALVGYDIEDSVITGNTGGTARLGFLITEMPAVGKLFQVTIDVNSGVPVKGNEIVLQQGSDFITAASVGAAGLLWYEPEVTYAGGGWYSC